MLQQIVDWLTYSIIGLDPASRLGESLNFFLYDVVKILVLLFLMIFTVGFLRTYIPQERVKKWLGGKRLGLGNIAAALFGAITPFCSCSSIPVFFSFLEAGIPLGVSFSFLVTSPLINEYLVVLMLGFFGWKITLVYVLSGLFLGVISGLVLGRMGLEKHLVKGLFAKKSEMKKELRHDSIRQRLLFGLHEAKSILGKTWLWVVVGVGLAAAIHNWIPQEWIQDVISRGGALTVPVAALLGVPMYGSCAAIVPVAVVLFQKGIPLGTALAFMMATSALSLPEAVLLRRAMKLKLIAVFFGIVALGIVLIGYLVNALQPLFV